MFRIPLIMFRILLIMFRTLLTMFCTLLTMFRILLMYAVHHQCTSWIATHSSLLLPPPPPIQSISTGRLMETRCSAGNHDWKD